jgi:hypothetical protein
MRNPRLSLLFLAGSLACGGPPPPTGGTEQTPSYQCNNPPVVLLGTTQPGDFCSHYSECAAVCCVCPNGIDSYNAAACVNGLCDGPTDACNDTIDSTVCPP